MLKFNLLKGVMLGLCMSILATGAALANERSGGQSGFEGEKILLEDKGEIEPWAPSETDRKAPDINENVLLKQREVDQYVFSDHANDLYNMGFKVVYTGPADDLVEIGITPYEDAFADYLYKVFGKDSIVVVAGEQAYLYTTMTVDTGSDIPTFDADPERYVGDDMVLGEGEFGITSISDDTAERFVGDDLVLADGEMGIVSIDEDAANKMAESGMIERTSANEEANNSIFKNTLLIIIAALVVVLLSGYVLFKNKKRIA